MKKLLFITTRLFWPTDSGRKVSLYYYCKGLHETCGYEIYLYSFLEEKQKREDAKARPDFIREVRLASEIGKGTKLRNLFGALLSGEPFQNAIMKSKKNFHAIKRYAEELQPDAIIVDMIRLAPYYRAIAGEKCLKILDLDDLLSLRYARQAKAENGGSLLGNYAEESGLLKSSFLKRWVLKSESKRVGRCERKYGKLYDKVIFVSQNETDAFNRRLHEERAVTVRMGVDFSYYSALEHGAGGIEQGSLAFIGNFHYGANAETLELIAKKFLPHLPQAKIYLIGPASEEIRARYSLEQIQFCGFVEDVRPIIQKCALFVSPIAYGSGIKTKILEAMAMGIPVLTNSIGAEGIEGENEIHFCVEDDVEKLAKRAETLLQDEAAARAIGAAGQALVREKYQWEKIYPSFRDLGL